MVVLRKTSRLGQWLAAPTFPSEELTERARLLHHAAWISFAAATITFGAIALAQPEPAGRPLAALILVDLLVLVVLGISRFGYPTRAGIFAIAALLTLLTAVAASGGGIRSPSATMYFAIVLIAGVLLGPHAALRTAIVCAILATGLVVAELAGLIDPGATPYGPVGLLFMNLLYIAVVVTLTRVASKSMSDALARSESELAERREAEARLALAVEERERLLADLRERVKEMTLLQEVARLLHARWFFDRSVLAETVRMMPAAWQYPEHCEARIRYRDDTYATPGWRETPWMQSRAFETSTGSGVIEVAYTRELPPADEGPFLAEERALIDSLAEMLVGHLEGEHIETVRRDLEGQLRQSQKMEALGTLAGGIAHDFNNILTAIGGNVDLALLDAHDASMRGYLQEVKQAHERARDLVKRILVFSRRQEALKSVIALEPVVEEALNLIRVSAGQEIRLETHFAPGVPPVLADSSQIHQVLMNLATNAVHAMRDGGGTLSLRLDERTIRRPLEDGAPAELHPGRYVRLSMRDTGVGMSSEIRERLFEPFFTTKGVLGTGLGLSVVHGIVHDHGGAICVESEPGRGTLFELYFPAAVEIPEAAAPAAAAAPAGRGQHILCVDDEEAVLFVMTRTLERIGYSTTGCSTPGEALQTFRADPGAFDAVVTDMGMPGMSGLDLSKEMRAIRPDIPIAIASGYARPQTDPEDISAWIHKPPSREELAATLDELLTGASSR